jgi:biopolymer transport protein ExbD
MKTEFEFGDENSNEEVISEINITPLVDVMLLLMVIFLVTAPLMVNNLNIKLPKAIGASETKTISKTISIKEGGEIFFEGQHVTLEELSSQLAKISGNNEVVIKIAAHHNSAYQHIASTLSVLHKNKISNISFLTQN